MNYLMADKAIQDMNRRNIRAFDSLKTLKFDELNVFRSVSKVYDDSVRVAKKRYKSIALVAFEEALIACGVPAKEAEKRTEETIDDDWILDMLEEYDALTLYSFENEVERKTHRTTEAILASQDKVAAVDGALRLWTIQVRQYADNSVWYATIDGYQSAGVKKVRWIDEGDERVCKVCRKLNGKVFDIDKVPPQPHYRCRCLLEPVIEKKR